MPLMGLPVRSMVVTLDQAVVLISPGSGLTEAELKSAGDVTDIIAPNLLHCAGVPLASKVFPKARVWGPTGARELKPDIAWSGELYSWPHNQELTAIPIQGVPKLNEYVLFDRNSGTLFVADLFFNLQNERGLGPWIILNMFGTWKKLGISKFYLRYAQDRMAFATSVKSLLDLPIRTLAMAHGDLVTENPVARMKAAMEERQLL